MTRQSAKPTKREIAQVLGVMARNSDNPRAFAPVVRAARTPVSRPNDPRKVLERDVLKAGLKFLRHHPKVATVERTQSGVFTEGNRTIRVGFVGKLDISGLLKGGRGYEFECKRPTGKLTWAQQQRIMQVKDAGGVSGVFTSIEELARLLESA